MKELRRRSFCLLRWKKQQIYEERAQSPTNRGNVLIYTARALSSSKCWTFDHRPNRTRHLRALRLRLQGGKACEAIRAVTVNKKESNMAVGTASGRVIEVSERTNIAAVIKHVGVSSQVRLPTTCTSYAFIWRCLLVK